MMEMTINTVTMKANRAELVSIIGDLYIANSILVCEIAERKKQHDDVHVKWCKQDDEINKQAEEIRSLKSQRKVWREMLREEETRLLNVVQSLRSIDGSIQPTEEAIGLVNEVISTLGQLIRSKGE